MSTSTTSANLNPLQPFTYSLFTHEKNRPVIIYIRESHAFDEYRFIFNVLFYICGLTTLVVDCLLISFCELISNCLRFFSFVFPQLDGHCWIDCALSGWFSYLSGIFLVFLLIFGSKAIVDIISDFLILGKACHSTLFNSFENEVAFSGLCVKYKKNQNRDIWSYSTQVSKLNSSTSF